TPSVAALPPEVFGGGLAAVALLSLPPPQLARARAVMGITAALASSVRGVRDIIRAPPITGSIPCKCSSPEPRLSSGRRRLFELRSVRQPRPPEYTCGSTCL